MIDRVTISITSGNGGRGVVSGRREKYVPRGGPDGGHGGDGGAIRLVADPNLSTLAEYRYRRQFKAENGGHGSGGLRHGGNGSDEILRVPAGTEVWVEDGKDGYLLADLTSEGERLVVARGGRGGRGNSAFVSSTNRFPLLAEEGERGERITLRLELKLLADVGIVGVPNAGKSRLLAAASAARPKIAAYPFTTTEAALGVVERRNDSFVMVDIPGLIEGAHRGAGMGHDFLRHVERTRAIVHMVDGSAEDPEGDFQAVIDEVSLYGLGDLSDRRIVAVNKVDIPRARESAHALAGRLASEGAPVHLISAATGEGVDALLDDLLVMLRERQPISMREGSRDSDSPLPILTPRPRREEVSVRKRNTVYVVDAPAASRIASMINTRDWAAMMQLHQQLARLGVLRALGEAGVGPGDTVRLGELEWDWDGPMSDGTGGA